MTYLVQVYVTCTVDAENEEDALAKLKKAKHVSGSAAKGDIFIIAGFSGNEKLSQL